MTDITLTPVAARDHARGPADAPVTLIEYADFQCPYCVEAHAFVGAIERRFAGKLRFVFRQFPLRQIHAHAEAAAEAAEAAGAQGHFWEMYEQLFAHSNALGAADLIRYAQAAGVSDPVRFEHELEAGTYRSELDSAIERGETSGVDGTPMFFINGQPFEEEPTADGLAAAIETELRG
jgi:NhaA family Na+:H+ antiporter